METTKHVVTFWNVDYVDKGNTGHFVISSEKEDISDYDGSIVHHFPEVKLNLKKIELSKEEFTQLSHKDKVTYAESVIDELDEFLGSFDSEHGFADNDYHWFNDLSNPNPYYKYELTYYQGIGPVYKNKELWTKFYEKSMNFDEQGFMLKYDIESVMKDNLTKESYGCYLVWKMTEFYKLKEDYPKEYELYYLGKGGINN